MTLSSLAVGSLDLEPTFRKDVFEYTVNCGDPSASSGEITVDFQTSEPDAEVSAAYDYLGGGGSQPVYIWDEPPYKFSAWDCPGLITVTVQHGTERNTYKVHTKNSLSGTP